MQAILLGLLLAGSSLHPAQAADGDRRSPPRAAAITEGAGNLYVNRIQVTLSSLGGLIHDADAFWYGWGGPREYATFVYDQGIWITGKRNGSVGCLPFLWYSPYGPGPIIDGQPGLKIRPQDAPRYRIYKLTRGDTPDINQDLLAWPSDLGAPTDPAGNPRVSGDQMIWMVYNGADTALYPHSVDDKVAGRTQMPVEVHQTAFAHYGELNDTSVWANTIFFEWSVYNKGPDPLDSVFVSFWTDLDFIEAFHTIPGIDTLAQTGYCWYAPDSSYASAGYTLLFGPTVPSPGDTATTFGKRLPGYRNLTLTSFYGIYDDGGGRYPPPYSPSTAWNIVRGLSFNGTPFIDSTTGLPTRFPFAGDPVTGSGYVCPWRFTGGGAGFMMSTGPFALAPGDSQWIMIALIPSVKRDGIDAINRMRADARFLRSLPYDSLITKKPARSVPTNPLPVFDIPASYALFSNYPNPFNAGTTIPFELPERSSVLIEVYDLLGRSVATLAGEIIERGHRTVRWTPLQSTGVYIVRMNATSLESQRSWSGTRKVVLMR